MTVLERHRRSIATSIGIAACLLVAAGCLALRGFVGVSIVSGDSMRPALAPGDMLVYRRQAWPVRTGDVVVVERTGWPGGIAHRVVGIDPAGSLLTRGDANPVEDAAPVPRGMVAGRVVIIVPAGRAAGAVASAVRRWYTHVPIAHEATTERRLSPRAVTGIGLR